MARRSDPSDVSEPTVVRPSAQRRPTMRDIAAEAGVSKGLVSLILSGAPGPSAETTERVLAIAKQLNYRTDRAASLLSRRRTRLLGVTTIPSNAYHGEIVDEIQSTLESAGYDMVLGSMTRPDDERRAIETLLGFRCEGLLLIGPVLPTAELGELMAGVPSVCVGRPLIGSGAAGIDIDVVRADDASGIHDVIDHLAGLGHRQITHVDGGGGAISEYRRNAFEDAVRRHGLAGRVVPGGLTERDGSRAADALDLDWTTAVVAFNDRCALGVLDRLDAVGCSVPGHVSLSGFDDSSVTRLRRIDLTSVNQAPHEQARLAVRLLIDRLDSRRQEPREIVLPCRLVVRGTTGPVRSS